MNIENQATDDRAWMLIRGHKTLEAIDHLQYQIESVYDSFRLYEQRDKEGCNADVLARQLWNEAVVMCGEALRRLEITGYGVSLCLFDILMVRDLVRKPINDFWAHRITKFVVKKDRRDYGHEVYEHAEKLAGLMAISSKQGNHQYLPCDHLERESNDES